MVPFLVLLTLLGLARAEIFASRNISSVLIFPEDYDVCVAPLEAAGRPTIVEFAFIVDDILQVDDKTFSLTVELKLTMTWKDSRVTLNTTRRATNGRVDGSQKLTFPASSQNEIWFPSFSIGHLISFEKLETLQPVDFLAIRPEANSSEFRFLHQGTYVVRLKCPMNFNKFPFDKHLCFFEVYSQLPPSIVHFQYKGNDSINWGWAATSTTLGYDTQFQPLPRESWFKEIHLTNGTEIRVTNTGFQIKLERKVNYYLFNYYISSSLFVISSWASFVIIPENVPGRIALIITTLLVLVNVANTVFAISPAADILNALQAWILFCIFFVFITVIEYAVILGMLRHERSRQLRQPMATALGSAIAAGTIVVAPGASVQQRNGGSAAPGTTSRYGSTGGRSNRSESVVDPVGTPTGTTKMARETKLHIFIAKIDYTFVFLMSTAFFLFNIIYWTAYVGRD